VLSELRVIRRGRLVLIPGVKTKNWVKTKNKAYWRYGEELESLQHSLERRALRRESAVR
jgi:hypothetical protein